MNRNSWIAVGLIVVVGLAVFGMFWSLPRHDDYLSQERRAPLADETLP